MKLTVIKSAIVFTLLLTSCTSIPLSTAWKLRNFDPLEAETAHIRIAVITNELVQLEDNAVSLQLGFQSTQAEHNFQSTSNATVEANANVSELNQSLNNDQRITLFYLDEAAAHEMKLSLNRIKVIKENNVDGNGSFGVNIHTGCFNGPKPKLLATIYAKFKPQQGYIKMLSNIDLLNQVDSEQSEFWVQCDAGL